MSEDRRMEAEQRYIAGDETLQEIAAALGIPLSSLKRWCKADKWVEKRARVKKRAARKAATKAVNKKAKALARLLEASDEMERALLTSARALADYAEKHPGTVSGAQSMKLLNVSRSIESMAHTRQMTGDAITAADREKIAILKKKQTLEEKQAALEEKKDAGDAVIKLQGESEGLSE